MKKQICIVPKLSGLGGMVSFQAKFIRGLQARHIPYSFDLSHPDNTAILVIGGTRQLLQLWRAKRRGVPVIQRLNGMNWMHKVTKTPLRAYLKAEMNNHLLALIRRFIANQIIYQSNFSREWWDRVYSPKNGPIDIVHNGVDLATYSPDGPEAPPADHYRILLVEGHLGTANARGLETAIKLAQAVRNQLARPVELMVVADVDDATIARAHQAAPDVWITWQGVVPHENIPKIDRSAHVLFSADLNAACPNSVIEALACGCPVLAYDTGALGELLKDSGGEVVDYGADYWQLEEPNLTPLVKACIDIFTYNPNYRTDACQRAEEAFSLDVMVDDYLRVLGV